MELGCRQFSQLSYNMLSSSFSFSFSFSSKIFTPFFPFPNYKSPAKHVHVIRAQRLRDDEGNYYYSWKDKKNKKNMVDANMSILNERIQEMKKKEKNYYYDVRGVEKGWNYEGTAGYDETWHRRSRMLAETIEIVGFVGTTLGLVFITGSLFVFLLSLLLLRFPIT